MTNIYSKNGFVELIRVFEQEGKMSRWDLEKMISESIREVLEMLFGKQIAPVVEDSLEPKDPEKKDFDPVQFMEKLEMLFGNDAKSIRIMIAGKMLTQYHRQEFMKNLGLPVTR